MFENAFYAIYSGLNIIHVGDTKVMVATGVTTYHKDPVSGALLPVKIVSPIAIEKNGKFSLVFPLQYWNYRMTGSAKNFEQVEKFWRSVSDEYGNVRSIVSIGLTVKKSDKTGDPLKLYELGRSSIFELYCLYRT